MKSSLVWLIFVLVINGAFTCFRQQQAVAYKVEARKPVRGNAETFDTQFEIIHGTHFWTVRNIFALEFAQVREFSSKTFQVESNHGHGITTIFR